MKNRAPNRRRGLKAISGGLDSHLDICSDPAFATHFGDPLVEPISWSLWRGRRRDEEIRVTLSRYEGKPIFDVRIFFVTPTGHMQASKKGIAFSVNRLPDFYKAIEKAYGKAIDLQLIEAAK
jgi:hypothetical protein